MMLEQIGLRTLLVIATIFCGVASAKDVNAVLATSPIKIDGKLDESAWKSAPVLGPLVHLKKNPKNKPIPKNLQTTFRVLYNDNGVYFGIRANETNVKKIKKAEKKKIDSALWADDDIEVFIDTNRDRKEYYQFATGPGDAKADFYLIEAGNTGSAGYNPDWRAATHIGKDFYSTEIFIPYAAFYKQRLAAGAQTWLISVCRNRCAGREFRYTRLTHSSKGGFHDVNTMIPLKGITVPKTFAQIRILEFTIKTEKENGKFKCVASMKANLIAGGKRAVKFNLSTKSAKVALKRELSISAKKIVLPQITVPVEGQSIFDLNVTDASTGAMLFTNRFVRNVKYQPLKLTLLSPEYRDNIYATEKFDGIKAVIRPNSPRESYSGGRLTVAFNSSNGTPIAKKIFPATPEIKIFLPLKNLKTGDYVLKTSLANAAGKVIAVLNTNIRKLPRAPAVEMRITRENKLLINGVPLMIRGWFGGIGYITPTAAFPACRTPRSMNFQGISERDAMNYGVYHMADISRVKGLEEACKKSEKLSDSIKNGI